MRKSFVYLLCFTMFFIVTGCGEQQSTEKADESGTAAGDSTRAVCAALGNLEESLDALEDSESLDEYKANYELVQQDFQELRSADGGEHQAELNAFESSLSEFQNSLSSFDDGGLISGLLDLASDAAELAAAGEALDEAIDC